MFSILSYVEWHYEVSNLKCTIMWVVLGYFRVLCYGVMKFEYSCSDYGVTKFVRKNVIARELVTRFKFPLYIKAIIVEGTSVAEVDPAYFLPSDAL